MIRPGGGGVNGGGTPFPGGRPRSAGETTLLRLAASVEKGSEHSLAAAIVAGASERGAGTGEVVEFASHTGKGVSGTVDGRRVLLGNKKLLEESRIDTGALTAQSEALRAEGQTVMFVAVDGKAAGLLAVSDPIKETTPEAIRQLHGEGMRIVMLTGDNRVTAEAVAKKLGLDEVVAEVLPDEKAAAMSFSSVSVVGNTLRLRRARI